MLGKKLIEKQKIEENQFFLILFKEFDYQNTLKNLNYRNKKKVKFFTFLTMFC